VLVLMVVNRILLFQTDMDLFTVASMLSRTMTGNVLLK
jgi:hypothetical protein